MNDVLKRNAEYWTKELIAMHHNHNVTLDHMDCGGIASIISLLMLEVSK